MSKEKKEVPKIPRTFMTRAYLMQVEPGLYGLFRNIEMETDEVDKEGKPVREKVSTLGPISLLREATSEEEKRAKGIVMQTWHPVEDRIMELVEAKN